MSPKELGALADLYWDVYHRRISADKDAAKLKLEENSYKATLIEEMRMEEITSIGGEKIKLSLSSELVPTVESWEKVYEFIKETDGWDLLEKRIGKLACKARWEADVLVPGVQKFRVYKLSKSEVK